MKRSGVLTVGVPLLACVGVLATWVSSAEGATPAPGLSVSDVALVKREAAKFMSAPGAVEATKAKGKDVTSAYFPGEKPFGDLQATVEADDIVVIRMTQNLHVEGAMSGLANGVLKGKTPVAVTELVDARTGQAVASWIMFTPEQAASGDLARVVSVANKAGSASGSAVVQKVDTSK